VLANELVLIRAETSLSGAALCAYTVLANDSTTAMAAANAFLVMVHSMVILPNDVDPAVPQPVLPLPKAT
jgi:hypothetical protein